MVYCNLRISLSAVKIYAFYSIKYTYSSIYMFLNYYQYLLIWIMVVHQIQSRKPTGKGQLAVWQLECELGIITDPECPVDGGWSPWNAWSPCHGPCDDVGHRIRIRECNNPLPSQEGAACSGPEDQTEVCYLTNCTVEDFRKLISGDSARMEALNHLETVPALMERCLTNECLFEAIEDALKSDNVWQLNPDFLWNALQCVRHNLGCSIVGEWGAWGPWSSCGARCGQGLKWRLRRCDTPSPSNFNLVCTGSPLQAEECLGDQCAISTRNAGGSWGEWSPWSPCSEICGPGVRRRRRTCQETDSPHADGTWGTHCRGQYDELQVCKNTVCNIDGGWSGWGGWGPCSQTCGAGKMTRTRSCTRPNPAGSGKFCVGPRTEIGSCHLSPCEGFIRTVALFNCESSLQYEIKNRRATLFHFYMRFMPLSPHGTLVRKEAGDGSYVRLSMHKRHVCLDACGTGRSCCLARSCSHSRLEPAAWHSIIISLTNKGSMFRLDDSSMSYRSTWTCDPNLPDDKSNVYVGQKFRGQIAELILNFIPMKMSIKGDRKIRSSDFYPTAVSNIAYEKTTSTEAYLKIENDYYLRLPCFKNQEEWKLELTIRPKKETGTILFLTNDDSTIWLLVELQNSRLKLKLVIDEYRSESSSTTECLPDKWLDVTLTKKREISAIEASINAGERLHVLFDNMTRKRRDYQNSDLLEANHKSAPNISNHQLKTYLICTDEFFIGGVPKKIREHIIFEDFSPFLGILASVKLNNEFLDLHDYSLERYKNNKVQVSSRTASISGSYRETAWDKTHRLNLTCIHGKTPKIPRSAVWLFMDTVIDGALNERTLRSVDDGRILRLVASADSDLRGFYTCRAFSRGQTSNIVTYGVLGRIQYKLRGPDMVTLIAVITTVTLVLVTLVWLFIEGIHDLRTGYGFFRDAHLSPKEEAEAVCKYIDQNMLLMVSKSAAQIAKIKARRRGQQILTSRANFAAQEPQGLIEEDLRLSDDVKSDTSEPEGLPTLPEIRSSGVVVSHDVYRFEPCYISSPRHGSLSPPHIKASSSSSFELVSPRILCSKLLMAKRLRCYRDNISPKKRDRMRFSGPDRVRSLLTIKSSSLMQPTPGRKILQKFQELKCDDY